MVPQQSPQQPGGQAQDFSLEGVRLTKDGVPRKKPGRKPGTTVAKKAADGTNPAMATATASGSGVDKLKRPRKPRDPSAPPMARKKRATGSDANETVGSTGLSRSSSANMHFEPKHELTSMRMDIDSRPAPRSLGPSAILHQQPRQPPLTMIDKMPKREHPPSSMMSILNADDSPPRPSQPATTSTTPVRSIGQSYDPVRSSTYDPVRETMMSRDPYGTGPLGSPRAPSHVTTNRASASPSIASLVDPAPSTHRSPVGQFALASQHSPPSMSVAAATTSSNNPPVSRHRENVPSLPPSPSPAPPMRTFAVPTPSSSTKPSPQAAPKSKSASSEAAPPMATISSLADASRPPSDAALSADAKSAAKKDAQGLSKSSKPPPPPPVPTAAKTASGKPMTTKAAEKAAEKAEKAAEKAEKAAEKAAEKKAAAAAKAAIKTAKATAKSAAKAAGKASTKSAAATEASAPSSPETSTISKASDPKTVASSEDVVMSGTESAAPANNAPHIKKFASILQQERGGKKSAASSPKLTAAKGDAVGALAVPDASPLLAGSEPERSILDFGKAMPGEENVVPSIVLHIPLVQGESNTYINFMRLAENQFGWDALHPRLAAHRDRKLRIAAASAALERNGSGRESGDEMTDDMQSGDEGSNEENGAGADNGNATANASGIEDAPAKPARKKRTFKEDEYDRDDDFVDDSEMLWEEQAAASRDGFFVYSGPLVPEEEKPEEGATTPAKRGRGSRGGRGGARSAVGRSAAGRSTTGRGGGPGSRGGTTYRRPRMTKVEKEQRDREKAEQDGTKATKAKAAKTAKAAADSNVDTSSPFSTSMAIDL
ncbi:hypothetical protein HMPREF1624_04071 [Sporothrix schenckii ATCC 58251]|uniref:Hpc2-related domain-containing protein n=1 Tax=Sporothrix schenckii (strain ATCC 58251 / de Perez 2211183) TaxID=1391915 RepID=U7PVY4_SPOS1|nr:hypothetical protein HMPREF1624_04071 [Sporothrix schenckii ATCC 58251]